MIGGDFMDEDGLLKEEEFLDEEKKDRTWIKKLLIGFGIFLLFLGCLLLYSRFCATTGLKVKEYKVVDSSIPEYFHGLKVVQFSDVHYGRTVNQKEFESLVDKINELRPDIVVFTGDLVDDDTELTNDMVKEIASLLNKIEAKIGKYAIMGNHDYQFKEWSTIIKNGGFINLNDTYDLIYDDGYEPIMLAGISTNLHGTKNIKDKSVPIFEYFEQVEMLKNQEQTKDNNDEQATIDVNDEVEDGIIVDESVYEILLIHEPDFIENIDYKKFDLILAGHSHNGQVRLPVIGAVVKPIGAKTYYDEYYSLENTDLYISSGIGVSAVNFRLFNRPSINFYRIVNH